MESATKTPSKLRGIRVVNTSVFKLLILLAVSVFPTIFAAEPTDQSRRPELDEIVHNLLEIHPNGARVQADAKFQSFVKEFRKKSDSIDLADYVTGLHKLFSFYKDGHTAVLSINMDTDPYELRLPVLIRVFADGMYVTEAKDEALPLLESA